MALPISIDIFTRIFSLKMSISLTQRSFSVFIFENSPFAGSKYAVTKFVADAKRSEEHTSELQSLMRISYAVFCLKNKNQPLTATITSYTQSTNLLTQHKST